MEIKFARYNNLNLVSQREICDLTQLLDLTANKLLERAISELAERHGVSHKICQWLHKKQQKQVYCIKNRSWLDVDKCLSCLDWLDEL